MAHVDEGPVPEHEAEPEPEIGAVVAMVHEPELWSLHCCRGKPTQHTQQQLKARYGGRSSLAPPNYAMQFEALDSRGCAQLVVAEGLPARCRRLPPESWPSVGTGGTALKHHDLAYQRAIALCDGWQKMLTSLASFANRHKAGPGNIMQPPGTKVGQGGTKLQRPWYQKVYHMVPKSQPTGTKV
jgi:hypothetical protein